jgi:hypothetical protein
MNDGQGNLQLATPLMQVWMYLGRKEGSNKERKERREEG